jgi:hypothetical protein
VSVMRTTVRCCVAVAALAMASVAHAQVTQSFSDVQDSLHAGDRLTITDLAGVAKDGSLVSLSDQSLRLMVRSIGPMDMSRSSIAKIERVTSLAKRGALVGLLGGALTGALAVALTAPCKGFCVGPSKEAAILPVAGIFGGIGAGVGALIGASRHAHQLIYLAPGGKADGS